MRNATLTQVVQAVNTRAAMLNPVDVGDRIDRYQYQFEDGRETGRMVRLAEANAAARSFDLTRRAQSQLLSRLGIPVHYFDRCPSKLKWANINWFAQHGGYDREVTVRTVQGDRARAILTQDYTPLDDMDVIPMIADILGDDEVTIEQADFADDFTHMRILFPRERTEARAGDIIQTGMHITNSEVGLRAVHIEPLVFRLVCTNGLVRPEGGGRTSIRHVGNPARLKDSVARAIEDAKTGASTLIEEFKRSVDHVLGDPMALIESHAKQQDLTKEQLNAVLDAFVTEADETLFGAVNAFTHAAQREESFERRYQMERVGGALLARVSHN